MPPPAGTGPWESRFPPPFGSTPPLWNHPAPHRCHGHSSTPGSSERAYSPGRRPGHTAPPPAGGLQARRSPPPGTTPGSSHPAYHPGPPPVGSRPARPSAAPHPRPGCPAAPSRAPSAPLRPQRGKRCPRTGGRHPVPPLPETRSPGSHSDSNSSTHLLCIKAPLHPPQRRRPAGCRPPETRTPCPGI